MNGFSFRIHSTEFEYSKKMGNTDQHKMKVTKNPQEQSIPKRMTLRPLGVSSESTIKLCEELSGFRTNGMQLGNVKFDSPHLSNHNKTECFMVAQFPLMVQNEMQDLIERKLPQYRGDGNGVVFFRGQVTSDNIFFNKIEELENVNNLPDILITSDINSLYHRCDMINEHYFDVFQYAAHPVYSGTGLAKQGEVMRYLAADALVLVVDRTKYEHSAFPREWYELLHPALERSIVFCGDRDFYNHTLYAHFVRDFGLNALKQLRKNMHETMHPIDMVRALQSGNTVDAKIYVMPYSYARMVENYIDYQIIWPEDGAIILPVQMLVKKGSYERNKDLISLLTSAEAGKVFALSGLIPVNRNTDCSFVCGRLNWLGWDFLKSTDLRVLKKDICHYLELNLTNR